MEIKSNAMGSWTLNSPPSALAGAPACLVSGADIGGVTDLCLSLSRSDERITLEGNEITYQAISSHTETLSLFGGGTIVLARGATEKHVKDLAKILEVGINPGSKLIVQAGSLKGASKLKKLFASDKLAKSVVLYTMRGDEITTFVDGVAKENGCTIERSCRSLIGSEVSGDRALAARTAETLCLHAIGSDRNQITREDVMAVCRGIDEGDLSAPLDMALQGKLGDALGSLDDKLLRGENPIALMRIFTYRLNRYLALSQSGLSPSAAIGKARPPVFWTEKDMFARILGRHDAISLQKAMVMIDRCEDRIVEGAVKPAVALPDLLLNLSKGNLKWPKF